MLPPPVTFPGASWAMATERALRINKPTTAIVGNDRPFSTPCFIQPPFYARGRTAVDGWSVFRGRFALESDCTLSRCVRDADSHREVIGSTKFGRIGDLSRVCIL